MGDMVQMPMILCENTNAAATHFAHPHAGPYMRAPKRADGVLSGESVGSWDSVWELGDTVIKCMQARDGGRDPTCKLLMNTTPVISPAKGTRVRRSDQ